MSYPPPANVVPAPDGAVPQRQPRKPLITPTLVGITISVYLLQLGSQMFLGEDYMAMLGLKVNHLIIEGQFWRLLTPVLLHGSFFHIGFNMYALFSLGPGLELFYKRERFLILYLLAGFTGNVASFLFSPASSLGASTAIFGLLGAEGMFLYQNRVLFGAGAQRSLVNVIMIAVVNLIIGLQPGIDNWGHIGGLAGGTLFAWFAGPRYHVEAGMYQNVLVDERDLGDGIRAALGVGGFFALLAAVKIFLS
jgi:rhomboid protease GluP